MRGFHFVVASFAVSVKWAPTLTQWVISRNRGNLSNPRTGAAYAARAKILSADLGVNRWHLLLHLLIQLLAKCALKRLGALVA